MSHPRNPHPPMRCATFDALPPGRVVADITVVHPDGSCLAHQEVPIADLGPTMVALRQQFPQPFRIDIKARELPSPASTETPSQVPTERTRP